MRALVTGATGFLGGALVRRLASEGHEVHALLRRASAPSTVDALGSGIALHVHDGSTQSALAIVGRARPDVVLHLACLAISEHTAAQIEPLVRSNVLLPLQLLEAMAASGVRRLVNVGSAWQHHGGAAYEPVCLYGALKQAVEDVIAYYVASAQLSAVTVKLFHVYGPGDERMRLVSALARSARCGEALEMTGGEQVVDLLHVDDAVSALICAAELASAATAPGHAVYAAESGAPLRVRDLVDAFARATGVRPPARFGARPYKPRELLAPLPAGAMGAPLPGWKPRVTLDEGLRHVFANLDDPEE